MSAAWKETIEYSPEFFTTQLRKDARQLYPYLFFLSYFLRR